MSRATLQSLNSEDMVHETLRGLRNWLSLGKDGLTMDGDMVAAFISLLVFYEASYTILQHRLQGNPIPIEPGGNVVLFPTAHDRVHDSQTTGESE